MKETPNYYSIIPADVRYDKNLKDKAKLLYSEITALSDKYGYCYASNKYFAELYGVSVTTISLLIKDLVDNEYIESEIIYKEGTKEILNRYLKIIKGGYLRNLKEGYLRKVKDNNTSINNTSINIKENIKRKVFIKPTIEEIQEYCSERKNGINANAFYDFYESKDWMVGKNKMKDWKACIRTWESRNKKEGIVPSWLGKEIKKEELNDEERRELEAIKNGTYRA
jgi:hypothetical protein